MFVSVRVCAHAPKPCLCSPHCAVCGACTVLPDCAPPHSPAFTTCPGPHIHRGSIPGVAAHRAWPAANTATVAGRGGWGRWAAGAQPALRGAVQLRGCQPCGCCLPCTSLRS